LLLAAAAAFAIVQSRPRPTWYVEPGLEQQWAELLEIVPPPPFTRLGPYDPAAGMGKGRYGVIISRQGPPDDSPDQAAEGAAPGEPPLRLYPGLYRDRGDYRGAVPLALDPWLVLRKTTDPPLSLERVLNPAGGAGALILPGAEPDAAFAWISQLLQRSPGGFPLEKEAWDEAERRLIYGNNRFQQGALTYTWFDGWIKLLQNEPAWLYAPLSKTRGLASYDTGRLDATIFPIPADWNTYGLQADILWAVPRFPDDQETLRGETQRWLTSAATQTAIARILGWIPAQPGEPYDTLAREAQVAWFSSSFIWQPNK
jgi:hypothetical protein